jgi:hypothetical protein
LISNNIFSLSCSCNFQDNCFSSPTYSCKENEREQERKKAYVQGKEGKRDLRPNEGQSFSEVYTTQQFSKWNNKSKNLKDEYNLWIK